MYYVSPLLGVLLLSPAPARAQERESPPVSRVEVFLTVADTLPGAVRSVMMAEAAAIWRQQEVAIEWLPASDARSPAPNRLRAMVVERRPMPTRVDGPFAVGELVRSANSHPIALISIERAEWLVASARSSAGYELTARDEQRLGVVLGRALAHEIGHFLLGTHTHARSGLMRPRFDAVEFTDLRQGSFSLDQDAAAWLRTGGDRKFVYARR